METSKFKFNPANLGAAKLGVRSSNDSFPELIVKQTPAQFGINGKAVDLLGAKSGDNIAFIVNNGAEHLGEQFLVGIAPEGYVNAAKMASVAKTNAGKTLNFSWHSMWSIAQQQSVDATELGNEGLLKLGVIDKTEKAYVAKNRISYKLVDAELDGVEIDGAVFDKLFVLTEPRKLDIVVRNAAGEEDEPEDEDEYKTEV